LLLDFPASIISRASSATETLTRLTNHTIRAGSLPKPLSASFGYLKEQTFPTKLIKLYHIFRFSTIPNTFKFFHAATLSIGTEYGTIRSNSNGEPAMGTMTSPIRRPRLDKDVVPFTEYRRTLNDCFERTARTHRPIVITQNGRSTSVMMSVADFERTWDEIEAWREKAEITKAVEIPRQQFAEGKFRSEEEVFNRLNNMLLSMKEKGEIE
jgi:prevent-host-death family protein